VAVVLVSSYQQVLLSGADLVLLPVRLKTVKRLARGLLMEWASIILQLKCDLAVKEDVEKIS
jgi:hypothetical protein